MINVNHLKMIIFMILLYLIKFIFINKKNTPNQKFALTESDSNKNLIFNQIKQNIIQTKTKLGKTRFGLVLKNGYPIIRLISNAYGYNAIFELAFYVEKYVDIFYVANIIDGIYLRLSGIKKPIMVLYLIDPEKINLVIKYDLEIIIPSIEWYYLAQSYLNKSNSNINTNTNTNTKSKQIKAHMWCDSGMGKEGKKSHSEILSLYLFLKARPNIKLIGLGTKYNTRDVSYATSLTKLKTKNIPTDLIIQHLNFVKLVKTISDPDLIIHTACTFEVRRDFTESYFGSKGAVRVGTLIYRNIKWYQSLLEIKTMSDTDCYGYYCEKTEKKPSNKQFQMGLIKNYLSLQTEQINDLKLYDKENKLQKNILARYDPLAFKINPRSNLKVGSVLTFVYDDLFAYI
jgi:hypothetical protein